MSFNSSAHGNERGSSFIEFLLLFPMLFFLFIGAVDMGFLCYAFIGTQDAARVGALYMSTSTSAAANTCAYVKTALSAMPNSSQFSSGCTAAPPTVTVGSPTTGPDGQSAITVTVAYQTIQLPAIPVPGFARQFTITRSVQMRVRS